MLRITLAVLHLLALGIGFAAAINRGLVLGEAPTDLSMRRVFRHDTMWGAAAGLWIVTGLWRLLAGTEKETSYYLANHFFYEKMGVLAIILALEIWPMIVLLRWRKALGKGRPVAEFASTRVARRIARISFVEAALVVCMVVAAVMMARGYGAR